MRILDKVKKVLKGQCPRVVGVCGAGPEQVTGDGGGVGHEDHCYEHEPESRQHPCGHTARATVKP